MKKLDKYKRPPSDEQSRNPDAYPEATEAPNEFETLESNQQEIATTAHDDENIQGQVDASSESKWTDAELRLYLEYQEHRADQWTEAIWQLDLMDGSPPQSLEEIYIRFYGVAMKLCCRIIYKDVMLAEDIVQDTFLKIWERNPQRVPNFHAYLRTSVRNAAIDALRKQKKYSTVGLSVVPETFQLNKEEYSRMLAKIDWPKYHMAIMSVLSKGELPVFQLLIEEQLTLDEAAIRLNIPKKKVENRLYNGRKKLKERYKINKGHLEKK